jgi:hypothetical protein
MFHPVIWEALEEYVADSAGNNAVEPLVGKKPIGTCGDVSKKDEVFETGHAHPIGFLGQRLDHQFLILLSPFTHSRVRSDDRADILDDVFRLPRSLVKRHSTGSQRIYNSSDVDFGPTGDTYMKVWEGKFDKLLYEI